MFSAKVKSIVLGVVVVAAFSVTAAAVNGSLQPVKGDGNSMSSSSAVSTSSAVPTASVDSNTASSSTPSDVSSSTPSSSASSDLGYTSNGDKIVSHYDNGKTGLEHVEITQTQPKAQKAPTTK